MLDLIQKCFCNDHLWPLWPACSQNKAGSDFPHLIQCHSSKEGLDHIVQNGPRFDLDGLVKIWPNASGLEASQYARIIRPASGKMQLAPYQFPTFRLSCVPPHDGQDHIV